MSDLDMLAEPSSVSPAPRAAGSRRWVIFVLLVAILGLAVSVSGAALLRGSAHTHERQTFNETAADVTATLDTLLRRDIDFVITLREVLGIEPHPSTHEFEGWFARLQGRQRLTGGLGALIVDRVPASALERFLAHR